ncbi:MAG: 30S ribosomal protein S7 [Flavobacteriales bacterium AspAUS03]
MRKDKAQRRSYSPDPRFKDPLVTRFVNHMMKDGKKTKAYGIFYKAMENIEQRKEDQEKSALEIWKEALKNVMPHVEVRTHRMGGTNIQVPVAIAPWVKLAKAIKSLIECARERNEKSMADKLAAETLVASKEEGAAVKKRENIHKMAEANKAFSHLRFTQLWQKI